MRYDLRHLTAFVAVAEELNFHRAAERLSMAQPAVSRIVLELEERLGVKLLERTTRTVRLTEPGRYLLEEAQEILARIEAAGNAVQMLAAGTKAILRIGYTTITGHALMPDIAREYRLESPEVRLELTFMTSPMQRDRILQGEVDFGLIDGSFQSSEIESRLVARHKLMALLPPGHPLARKTHLTIEDLAGEKLVMGTNSEWPTFRRIVADVFQSHGHVMNVGQEASSLTGLLGLVTAGVGITIFTAMPRFCGESVVAARPIVTDTPFVVQTHLAWRRASMTAAMRRFIETSQRVSRSYMLS
ncbi:LysR family transcriptional regulator [Prosthecomicrobium pneumaticum]|uniref:DNA-binding transcriptional LysR family regulator n=1 Tax=Prosthecomicrobium pneumaticum TaxID=81895 RepID=A0A7W9CUI0_9HYPH|nr:LysR substrate-binding domain-containing protein [Prosthecomicrobium pneumaticum]MBB5751909.1 DNA-binding transcriptional LysR family regulator [Prosthecomicrobium pneumaticum]